MNTLIIDNKKGYGRKIKRLLEKAIADSSAAAITTVLEALAELRHPHYDLIIIGHPFPEISTDEFLTILTNNNINIPVLIIDPTQLQPLRSAIRSKHACSESPPIMFPESSDDCVGDI
jgi:CheY-like chemotaxis protein